MKIYVRALRYVALLAVTLLAIGVMMYVSVSTNKEKAQVTRAHPTDPASAPKALVQVETIEPQMLEFYDTHSGMIQPWERYVLGFEVAGRVGSLGQNDQGEPLDEGDHVTQGQVLARLDERVLTARVKEATATLDRAQADLQRARELRQRDSGFLTAEELKARETDVELANAHLAIAEKNLQDAVLTSPIEGYIAQRMIKVGESVNPHQTVFEVVETDRVKLTVGVPEARVPEIIQRMREVDSSEAAASGDDAFLARVQLAGTDRFGREWEARTGEVHQLSETADEMTGQFYVEIDLPNRDGMLKPGMVARASLITRKEPGYRVPESAVIYRGGSAFMYLVEPEEESVRALFFDVGDMPIYRARRLNLDRWVEQRGEVLIPSSSDNPLNIIVRGQHRLIDGQLVRPFAEDEQTTIDRRPPTISRAPETTAAGM